MRFGEAASRISLALERRGAPATTEVTIRPGEPKRAVLNGAPVRSAEDLRLDLPTLAFTPDRLAVVKGGPLVRRSYVDRMLGRLVPALASLPEDYGRALAQRNAALRRARAGVSTLSALVPWTAQLAEMGSRLEAARAELVTVIASGFAGQATRLGLAAAVIAYDARPLTVESLDSRLERDLERGTTGAGPHLRDYEISAAGRDLRTFGSQGEQRTAVLALTLAEAALLEESRGEPPLLLLDDVLSELDRERRIALLAALPAGGQTIVTATSAEALPAGAAEPALVVAVTPGDARRA